MMLDVDRPAGLGFSELTVQRLGEVHSLCVWHERCNRAGQAHVSDFLWYSALILARLVHFADNRQLASRLPVSRPT
jgi:hypothetical protein